MKGKGKVILPFKDKPGPGRACQPSQLTGFTVSPQVPQHFPTEYKQYSANNLTSIWSSFLYSTIEKIAVTDLDSQASRMPSPNFIVWVCAASGALSIPTSTHPPFPHVLCLSFPAAPTLPLGALCICLDSWLGSASQRGLPSLPERDGIFTF